MKHMNRTLAAILALVLVVAIAATTVFATEYSRGRHFADADNNGVCDNQAANCVNETVCVNKTENCENKQENCDNSFADCENKQENCIRSRKTDVFKSKGNKKVYCGKSGFKNESVRHSCTIFS